MSNLSNDHPGVKIPPPLLYAACFFLSLGLQRLWPLAHPWFNSAAFRDLGFLLLGMASLCILPALFKFFRTRNTLITIRPARSLQTGGIYAYTRNPMYLGTLFLYLGLALLIGNWWTLLLSPFLLMGIQQYVIRREENYLRRAFGQEYYSYCQKVRRWI